MSNRLLRTFLSVPVPSTVVKLQKELKTVVNNHGAKVNWVRSDNIHVTLKFIGDMPEDDVDQIGNKIKDIIGSTQSMKFNIFGTGCFPKKERPRILWLGINGDLLPLQTLVTKINAELELLGYPKEEKIYIPHLTLARIKYPQKHTPDISSFLNAEYEPIQLQINKIHFMRSELFFKGSVYTILDTHFLT